MSVTLIVLLLAVVSALVGIKVYLEHREELKFDEVKIAELENKIEEPKTVVVEAPVEVKVEEPTPIVVEAPKKDKPKKKFYRKPGKKPFPKKKNQKQNKN